MGRKKYTPSLRNRDWVLIFSLNNQVVASFERLGHRNTTVCADYDGLWVLYFTRVLEVFPSKA